MGIIGDLKRIIGNLKRIIGCLLEHKRMVYLEHNLPTPTSATLDILPQQ